MTEQNERWAWAFGLVASLFVISTITCWNVLSDPEQVLAFNDGNIEFVLSPVFQFPGAWTRVWDNQFFFGSGVKQAGITTSSILESIGPVFTRRTAQPLLLALCGLAIYWSLRQFRFNRPASALTAAILVNTGWATTFSFVGLSVRPLALAFAFLATGFSEQGRTSGRWLPYAIGGACLGLGISEVPDVGAIMAIAVAFIFLWTHLAEYRKRPQTSDLRPQTKMQEDDSTALPEDARCSTALPKDVRCSTALRAEKFHGLWSNVYGLRSSVFGLRSTVYGLISMVLKLALVIAFSVLIAWQTLTTMFATQIAGVSQGSEETPTARYAWATQWSIPPAELWNTISGSHFGTTMRSENTPYWGRVGRSEGWEKTKQGFRNFSGAGWHLGVIPSILLLALPVWMLLTRHNRNPKENLNRSPQRSPNLLNFPPTADETSSLPSRPLRASVQMDPCSSPLPPRAFSWMICTGSTLAIMLMVGKYFVAYRILWMLPFFSTIRNPEKWNGPLMLFAGLGIAFMLDALWRSLSVSGSVNVSLSQKNSTLKKQMEGRPPCRPIPLATAEITARLAPWQALIWASLGVAVLGLLVMFWTQMDRAAFIEARTHEGYGTASALMWNNALSASLKVFLLTLVFGGTVYWLNRRLRHGKSASVWLFLGIVASLALGDLMALNRAYSMPHKYRQYLTANPLTDFLDAHRNEGRLKLLPPQHPLLNNLRLSLLQIKGYDLFEPISVSRMPSDYEALFKAFEKDPTRLWELGAVRYFLTLPSAVQQLNQMDGNRGRFMERAAMGIGIVNESYLPIAYAPPEQHYLRVVEFTGALPVYRMVSKVTSLPETPAGGDEALRRMAQPGFDLAHEAVIHGATPVELPKDTNTSSITVLRHDPAEATVQVVTEQAGLMIRAVKFDPDWKVTVDDKPAVLHRVNYLFQGVIVPQGQHTVNFAYTPSLSASYLSLATRGILLLMLATLIITKARQQGLPKEPFPHAGNA